MRLIVLSGLALWAGTALLLSELRWFSRPRMVTRLRLYSPGGMAAPDRGGVLSVESCREVVGPVSRLVGERAARLFGVTDQLSVRLERVHSPFDVTAFRVRQVGWSVAAVGLAALVSVAVRPDGFVAVLLLLGSPVLAFFVLEQQLSGASRRWQRRLFLELPVVSEQLAMLLSAGFSLGSALNRLAARGSGACASDLQRVTGRIRQGLSDVDALREWADVARVPALDRLVPVLALTARRATSAA